MVDAESLGHPACEAKRAPQGQGCRRSKACRHSAPNVDRRHRIQMVIKGGYCIGGQPSSRHQRETNVPAGTLALVRSPQALRCSKEQNALHTLIHQRHLTPSCGGRAPTAERTLNPARMFTESLTPGPELENSLGPSRPISFKDVTSAFGAKRKRAARHSPLPRSKMTHLRSGGCIAAVETVIDFCSGGRAITCHAADHAKGICFAGSVKRSTPPGNCRLNSRSPWSRSAVKPR